MRCNLVACSLVLATAFVVAQDSGTTVPHVSVVYPVVSAGQSLSADRPTVAPNLAARPRPRSANPAVNSWKLLATLPGTVIHDLTFVSPAVGYAAAEVGQVWKTTDGGKTWTEVLNLGFPYYFYGVQGHGNDVVVSGFVDSSTQQEGIIRWSHDGVKLGAATLSSQPPSGFSGCVMRTSRTV